METSLMIAELERRLSTNGISYQKTENTIRIDLPNNFGTLEIGMLEGDDSIIGLAGYEWHTHGEQLTFDSSESEAEAICNFVKAIFAGRYFLVERSKNGVTIDKYVENDRETIGKYIEVDEEEKICNEL